MSTMMRSLLGGLLLACLALPAAPAELGAETLLPASPRPAHDPAVSFGNDKYLVVWQSDRAETADIYGCRVDEAGKAIDAKPFVISGATECQERPRVAWGKDSWLVVWADIRNDKDYDVYAARVSTDGKVLDPDGIPVVKAPDNQCQPDVAFNGENFLVVWRAWVEKGGNYAAWGARLSADGKVLDPQGFKIAESTLMMGDTASNGVGTLRVAAVGGQWMAAWKDMGYPGAICASTVTAEGKTATTRVLMSANYGAPCARDPAGIASDGKGAFLVSWWNRFASDYAGGFPYAAVILDPQGKQLGTCDMGSTKPEVNKPAPAWDGKGWTLAYWDGKPSGSGPGRHVLPGGPVNRVAVHLLAADGKHEGDFEISSGKPNPTYAPAAAGDGKGNTLVVWERHPADNDPPEAPIVVAARMVKR
jgi:hypothetical protein